MNASMLHCRLFRAELGYFLANFINIKSQILLPSPLSFFILLSSVLLSRSQ